MSNLPPHAKKVFQGKVFEIWQWDQRLFDGSIAVFEKAKRADGVTVLPVTPDGMVVITEQLQPHWKTKICCLPGGVCDSGGTLEEEALRELREETGYTSNNWKAWKIFAPSERIDWKIHTFIARDAKKTHELDLDPGEQISVKLITLDELLDLADQSDFRHRDIQLDLIRAKYNKEARAALEKMIFE